MYKFKAPDGSTHFTNAPADPRYQRMGFTSGTEAGWLRLPQGDPEPYAREITEAANRYGIPERLVTAMIRAESGFNPRAVSRKGAQGLMQLMPGTAAVLGVRNSFDPAENIDGGVRHLRGLLERYGNNLPFALAAYNAGEGAVNMHGGIPPYPETQAYVGRILAILGGENVPALALSGANYRYVAEDGAVVYSNIPPRVTRAKR